MVSTSFSQVRKGAFGSGQVKAIMLGERIFAGRTGSELGHWAVVSSSAVLSPRGFGLCGGLIDLSRSAVKISRIAWYDWGFGVGCVGVDQLEEYPVVDRELENLPVVGDPGTILPGGCAAISAGFYR